MIEKTIRTLLASDYPHAKLEIIVLNDGSTDSTAEVLDRLAAEFPLIRPIHIPQGEGGKGKAAVLNRGLKLVRHEMIAIYDADNQPQPSSLRYLASQFALDPASNAGLDAALGGHQRVGA